MGRLELQGICKKFGEYQALDGITLEVSPGQILGLTGPSGAGKTTTCRIISGIESPTEGMVRLNGRVVNLQTPQKRCVAFMFESYALYPHLTVSENIAFPLKAPNQQSRYPADEVKRRVTEMMKMMEIAALGDRFPSELSGGQKQRVALCRSLIQEPAAYLLDEPISHLDAKLRHKLRGEVRRRLIKTDVPSIWTSPDALEALSVSDIVAILVKGRIHQIGTPQEVYRHPATVDVARLVGDPAINLLEGKIGREGPQLVFRHPAFQLPLTDALRQKLEGNGRAEEIILGIRPTEIQVREDEIKTGGLLAEVYVFEPFGKYGILSVRLGEDIIKIKTSSARTYQPGKKVQLDFEGSEMIAFDREIGRAMG